jgi:uncharacterized membrane protein
MNKFVVVIFPDEKKAYEGVRALKELHEDFALTLYSYAVIQRNAEGRASVKEKQTEGPVGVAVGALIGGLVGMFAGPLGVAAGLGAGTTLGAVRDLFNLGVSDEFLDTISKELTPGKTAVVAEVSEDWVMELDSRMEAIGGIVIREWRFDFIEEEIQKHTEQRKRALAQRKAELAAVRAEKGEAMKEKVEAMKKSVSKAEKILRDTADSAKARMNSYREETTAKIKALQGQAKKARGETKSRINKRTTEIRADQKRRLGKLEKASKLTQEAVRP